MTTMRRKDLQNVFVLGVLALTLLAGLQHPWLMAKVAQGYPDFIAFYTAGHFVREGRGGELFRHDTQGEFQSRIAGRPFPLPFYHPPFEALLFVPLSFLPLWNAYQVWALVNLGLIFACGYLLREYLAAVERLAFRVTLVAACVLPFFMTLLQGQDSLLLLLVYSGMFVSLKQGREFRAGSLLALGLFRPQLVLPFVVPLLLKKRWKFLWGFSAVATILAAASAGLVGAQGLRDWAEMIRLQSVDLSGAAGLTERTVHPEAMASLRGFISVVSGDSLPSFWVSALSLGLSGLLFLGILLLWRGELDPPGRRFDRLVAVTLVGVLLTSYHLNPHDLSLLFLPLALSFAAAERAPGETPFGGCLLLAATMAFALVCLYSWSAEGFFLLAVPLMLLFAFLGFDLVRVRTPAYFRRQL